MQKRKKNRIFGYVRSDFLQLVCLVRFTLRERQHCGPRGVLTIKSILNGHQAWTQDNKVTDQE